jgi:hypothetical protein
MVSRRIIQGKEDLKMASVIFEKDQEVSMLTKKNHLYENQVKQLERELDRVQEQLKRK